MAEKHIDFYAGGAFDLAMEDLISVIVPVYKVEPYLRRCVDSILGQSYSNLEIILVDDGSPDGCGAICDAYAARDPRVRVIHQENKGLSEARNAGIDIAQGSYIGFVDSDDWIEPSMYAELYQAVKECNADLSICDFGELSEDGKALWKGQNLRRETVGREEIMQRLAKDDVRLIIACNKLYSRSLFDEIRYPPGKINEDMFVIHKLLDCCSLVSIIPGRLYNYAQTQNSIMHTCFSVKRLDAVEARCDSFYFYQRRGYDTFLIEILSHVLSAYLLCKKNFRPKIRSEKRRWAEIKDMVHDIARANAGLLGGKARLAFAAPDIYLLLSRVKRMLYGAGCVLQWLVTLCKAFVSDVVLLCTPERGNLGDQAVALAEVQMLKEAFPGMRVMECSGAQMDKLLKLERRGVTLPFALTGRINRNPYYIHGGGVLGELRQEEEDRFRTILRSFPNRKIIVFPQTVYFNLSDTWGRAFFEESKKIYSEHPNLTVFVRERNSYDFLRTYMPEVHTELAPDGVACIKKSGVMKSEVQ